MPEVNSVIVSSSSNAIAVAPVPRCSINVRQAVADDLPFIDALQKMHTHMVGFLRYHEIKKHMAEGIVLIAEEKPASGVGTPIQVGYIIARDTYKSREELGIIYQLCVQPLRQKHLVGAMLVKAAFERAAYGCRLFCLWCAQDIQANWFWEAIGFVPLAFRTGSRAKQRIQIFWQRRVRENDEVTPYWFPSKTDKGGVNEDRIVLPIPPGTHWRDVKPLILPGLPAPEPEMPQLLPGGAPVKPRPEQPKLTAAQKAAIHRSQSKHLVGVPLGRKAVITPSGFKYIERTDYVPELDAPDELMEESKPKPRKPRAPRLKHDPKYVKAARELRDRYLEQINTERMLPPAAYGKYDVSRQLEAAPSTLQQTPLLQAA